MANATNTIARLFTTAFAAAATLVASALLCLSTGTAHAASTLDTTSDAFGVTVKISSTGSEGLCLYTAEPWFGWTTVKPLPVYKVPFHLQANQAHDLWFPGIQTGTTWKAKVECAVGGVDYFNPTY